MEIAVLGRSDKIDNGNIGQDFSFREIFVGRAGQRRVGQGKGVTSWDAGESGKEMAGMSFHAL